MNITQWYLMVAVGLIAVGLTRFLLVRDRVARLVAMNVLGSGALLLLIALAARQEPADPVLTALVITGLVITVAFTGVGAVLIRRIEGVHEEDDHP
ncbi:NADH-quinone oxidoreductase subunit K [Corynebacterium sp. YIM 101645]|uniref:NADH-quinone oxidoreductase subunit K n=1 Tax=Corynebacterium lemuris TaxID=1859292 RepID=A0ABT2G095_9CORY|nr:NADH-quinone oxidoreductase subunit K [Corynebacterium lemuris]MCS5480932.1 NADH-quinone oxidoreductase subunit K [Corynebacterium lemuris]